MEYCTATVADLIFTRSARITRALPRRTKSRTRLVQSGADVDDAWQTPPTSMFGLACGSPKATVLLPANSGISCRQHGIIETSHRTGPLVLPADDDGPIDRPAIQKPTQRMPVNTASRTRFVQRKFNRTAGGPRRRPPRDRGPPSARPRKLLTSPAFCVLVMFVFDVATAQAEALQPDPNRAVPPCIGKVLGLVRTLIAYGQNLINTLSSTPLTRISSPASPSSWTSSLPPISS